LLKHQEIEEKKKAKLAAKNNQKNNVPNKKPKWQKQSEEFRAIMQANRPSSSQEQTSNYGSKLIY
jgi:hypothetical protein